MKNKKIIIPTIIVIIVLAIFGYIYMGSTNNMNKVNTEKSSNLKEKSEAASASNTSQNKEISKDIESQNKENKQTYSEAAKNEYGSNGVTVENGNIVVKNKQTNNKKVTIQKATIDDVRGQLNKAGLPGNAYSDSDIANLIIKANNSSLDYVTAAKTKTK